MTPLFFHAPNERDLNGKELSLLKRLNRDYTNEILKNVLIPLITQTSPVSLRALDWAVVNWSKQHNVVCSSTVPGQMTNVHFAYRGALTYWKRRLFDPFRRRDRITLMFDGDKYETTLGQANFSLFTYQTGILAYVISHIDEIENDMNKVSRRQKRERIDAHRRGSVRNARNSLNLCKTFASRTTLPFELYSIESYFFLEIMNQTRKKK